jgi:hypothetical protein
MISVLHLVTLEDNRTIMMMEVPIGLTVLVILNPTTWTLPRSNLKKFSTPVLSEANRKSQA